MCGLIVSTDPKTDRKDFEKGLACLNDRLKEMDFQLYAMVNCMTLENVKKS